MSAVDGCYTCSTFVGHTVVRGIGFIMPRTSLFACFVTFILLAATRAPADDHTPEIPHWIWAPKTSGGGPASGVGPASAASQDVCLEKSFQVDQSVVAASLRCVGHSAGLKLSLDDELLADVEPYDPLVRVDVSERLGVGEHHLKVIAKPVAGPSAMFLLLEIRYADGTGATLMSDETWSSGPRSDANSAIELGAVDPRLVIPTSRQIGITAVDDYEQWKQALGTDAGADPASFWVSPGFEMRLVRSATDKEGSWVSMVTDPEGRLIIAKEDRGLLRMTLSHDGDRVTKSESIEDTLKECRGLVFFNDDLFVNANNTKGLYRLRAAGDRFAIPELIFASSGGVGHGRNDLALGPDGMLYSIHGDAVDLPGEAIDHTSPFRDARRGMKTSEGHLLRIDPNDGDVEVMSAGLRNPFGIDFNNLGDIFTYDADAEYDMGAPWYRPTRVSTLMPGGDYGWRGVTRSWPSYYPDHADNARPSLDIGKGSPTAVKFGTRSNFPTRFRDALFILDWAYGRIVAVHCMPRGSSYLMTAETFLKGRPLNVTDIDFAADGSMYLVTGGRKTQSALYRIRYVGDRTAATEVTNVNNDADRSRTEFASGSRSRRRALETKLLQSKRADSPSIEEFWPALSDADPWISEAAVRLLEQVPAKRWKARALAEQDLDAAVRSLLALSRVKNPDWSSEIVARLNEIAGDMRSRTNKLILLQAYSLCMTQAWMEGHREPLAVARAKIDAMYPDRSYLVNRTLSDLAVRLKTPNVVSKTMALLSKTQDQTEQMQYLYVLRNMRQGWTIENRKAYFSALNRSGDYVSGAGMADFLGKIRGESIATLSDGERVSLKNFLEPLREVSHSVTAKPREFVRKWTAKELVTPVEKPAAIDLQRGEKLFTEATCNRCHRIAGRGTLIGPDLTSASRRFSRHDLLMSIIEPSKVIAENYRSLQIVTTDGAIHVGQVVLGGDYRSSKLRLATDPISPQKIIEIEKKRIEKQQPSSQSWMPEGLLDTFSRDEIDDLMAYIESAQ